MTSDTGKKRDNSTPRDKYDNLKRRLSQLNSAAVCFSGGVDSALLAYAAREALEERTAAFTIWSPLLPESDKKEIVSFTDFFSIPLIKIVHDDLRYADFRENGPERCYICKKRRIKALADTAGKLGIRWLLDGTNTDDLCDNRPGIRALEGSPSVLTPFLEFGISKREIRNISSSLALPTALKPSAACLASRVPAGTEITKEMISLVDAGEALIRNFLPHCALLRMRYDGKLATIETDRENIPGLSKNFRTISSKLAEIGILHASIRPDGYITGGVISQRR